MFTAKRNFEEDIYVYNIKENTTTNITNTDITESDPIWSPDGHWLLFNIVNTDAYEPKNQSALLNLATCQVFPVNAFEGTAQGWVK